MKKFLFLFSFFLLAVSNLYAGEKTITISRNDVAWESANTVYNVTKGGVELVMSGGMNNPNFLLMKQHTTITVKSHNFNIKRIVFHCLDNYTNDNLDVFYWGPTTLSIQYSQTHAERAGTLTQNYQGSTYDALWVSTKSSSPGNYPNGLPAGYELMFENQGKPVRFASIDIVIEQEVGDMYELVTSTSEVNTTDNYMLVGRNSSTTTIGKALSVNPTGTAATDNQTSTPVTLIDNGLRVKAVGDVQFINFKPSTHSTYKYYIKAGEQYLRSQTAYQSPGNYNNGFCLTKVANANDNARVRVEINESGNTSVSNWEHYAEIVYQFSDSYKPSGSSSYYHYAIRHNNNNNQFRNLYVQGNTQQVYLYKPAKQYKVTTEVKPNATDGAIALRDGILVEVVNNETINYSQKMDTVQFLVTAAEGKKIASIDIQALDDNNQVVDHIAPLTTSQTINGTLYTFVMPGHDVNIVATFADVTYHNVNIVIEPDQRCGNVFVTEGYVVQNDQVKSYEGQNVIFNVISNLINIEDETEGSYTLTSVTVTDDITGQSITYNLSDGNYSFTMPDHPVTITATFTQPAPEPLYLLGTANGGYWTYQDNENTIWRTYGPVFNYNKNIGYYIDVYFKGEGEIGGNAGNAYGYFSLSKRYADNQDWNYINGHRLVAHQSDNDNEDIAHGDTKTLYADADNNRGSSFKIPAGIYRIVVDKNMTQVTVTRKDLSLYLDPAGGATAAQAQTVSSNTKVSLMGSLYNAIQAVNSSIITPANTPLYNANHDDANFKYKAVKIIGENVTTDEPVASTTTATTTLTEVNDGETVTELHGYNYLGWIVADNTAFYKVIYTPLSWIEKDGVPGNTYTVSDELIIVHILSREASGDYPEQRLIWAKDQGNRSNNPTSIKDGQIDYMRNVLEVQHDDWDQSNWVMLKFPDGTDLTDTYERDMCIKAGTLKGRYVDNVNYCIEVEVAPQIGGTKAYTPNVFSTPNYLDANLNLTDESTGAVSPVNQKSYFFMNPKVQEVADVVAAVWNGTYFVIPKKADGNNSADLNGAFTVGWDYNDHYDVSSNLAKGNVYSFRGVLNMKPANATGSSKLAVQYKDVTPDATKMVMPFDLNDQSVVTAISDVDAGKTVSNVKYYNIMGVESNKPFNGVNIVVTRYSDGTISTTKVLR